MYMMDRQNTKRIDLTIDTGFTRLFEAAYSGQSAIIYNHRVPVSAVVAHVVLAESYRKSYNNLVQPMCVVQQRRLGL